MSGPYENLGRHVRADGSILVATRNKQGGLGLGNEEIPVEVTRTDDDESEQLLRTKLGKVDASADELWTLSSRLDYVPLAKMQATVFMQENTMIVHGYLELLEGNDQDLVDLLGHEVETTGRDSDSLHAVMQARIFSFKQLEQQKSLAGELLSLSWPLRPVSHSARVLVWVQQGARKPRPTRKGLASEGSRHSQGILKAFSRASSPGAKIKA